ncbi:UNC93-like protein [Anabrus simplex]|uniref:UNC93-like protein n=1 Tax=Anabrus simplex TaxID=316456 RepID=UPI0035A3CC3C
MKTQDGEIDGASSTGESIQIASDSETARVGEDSATTGGDLTIQTKDTELQGSPNNASLREEHHRTHEVLNEIKTGFEANDVSENKGVENGSVEQEDSLEKGEVSEAINRTSRPSIEENKDHNSQTGFTVTKEVENDINQRPEGTHVSQQINSTEGEIIAPQDLNEDKNSLPEVDSHINQTVNNRDSVDDVDKSVNKISNNFEIKDTSPLLHQDTIISPNNVGNKDIPPNLSPSTQTRDVNKISNSLELKEIPPSEEAYDNPGFVRDEISASVTRVNANIDVVPIKTVSSEADIGNPKLSRRVSFSELPPKAVYNNLVFSGDEKEGGENGKVKQVSASGDKEEGQEIDFLAKYGPGEKWRILRNVVLMSAAFMILFTAFFGAANLQSSVNAKAGLGTASLTTLYGALVVSNMFLPVTVIRWLRCKWTVALMALGFAPYAMAQFHAEFYTLIPTALLAGLGAAPMWCAKCTYLNVAADAYAKVTGSAPELVMVRFFGVFYVLFPLGHVWGNLISSEVLSRGGEEESMNITVDVAALCGANYCPGLGATENPNLQRPPDYQINTIAGIFVACSLLAVLLVALGVDNLKRYNEGGRTDSGTGLSGLQLLVATARLLCNRNQIALIPITAFIGISQAFLGADFTEGYISCAWGIPHIGYVLIGYGLASSIASVFVSWVVKTAGRLVVICSSITLFLILVTVMKFWQPSASQGVVFFTLAALWGLADSTALVINAMYGLLFRGNEAAAYSNFSLWGSAGFIVTYSYSPHLCMNTKLAILAVVLILAMGGFIAAEMALRKIIREQQEEEKSKKAAAEQQVSIKPHVS